MLNIGPQPAVQHGGQGHWEGQAARALLLCYSYNQSFVLLMFVCFSCLCLCITSFMLVGSWVMGHGEGQAARHGEGGRIMGHGEGQAARALLLLFIVVIIVVIIIIISSIMLVCVCCC